MLRCGSRPFSLRRHLWVFPPWRRAGGIRQVSERAAQRDCPWLPLLIVLERTFCALLLWSSRGACWGRASSCYLSLSSAGFICSQPLLESSRNIKSAGPQIDGEPGPQRTQTKDACPSSHLYSLIIYPRMPWRVHAVEVGRDRCTCLYLDAVPCI